MLCGAVVLTSRARRSLITDRAAGPDGFVAGAADGPMDLPAGSDTSVRAAEALNATDTSYLCVIDKAGNCFSATPSDGVSGGPMVPLSAAHVGGCPCHVWLHPATVTRPCEAPAPPGSPAPATVTRPCRAPTLAGVAPPPPPSPAHVRRRPSPGSLRPHHRHPREGGDPGWRPREWTGGRRCGRSCRPSMADPGMRRSLWGDGPGSPPVGRSRA